MAETTPPSRSDVVRDRTIDLTQTDPLLRLRQFCKQGKYKYKIIWDRFQNGMMMECEVWYFLGKKKRHTLTREVQFVYTTDVKEGQRIISAILLQNIGLGFDEDEVCYSSEEEEGGVCEDPLVGGEKIAKLGIATMNSLLAQAVKDLPDGNPGDQGGVNMLSNVLNAFGPVLTENINPGVAEEE